MTVFNNGGTPAYLDPSTANTYLTFAGLTSNYTITPSPSNVTLVAAGATASLQFNVAVGSPAAAPGSDGPERPCVRHRCRDRRGAQ